MTVLSERPVDIKTGHSTMCRRGDHTACATAKAHCVCPCHKGRQEPPVARTRPDVAVAVNIWRSGLLRPDTTVKALAAAAGVPVALLSEAVKDDPEPRERGLRIGRRRQARADRGRPEASRRLVDPTRRCTGCGATRPKTDFESSHGVCGPCRQKLDERGLRLSFSVKAGLVNNGHHRIHRGDPLVNQPCVCCRRPLKVGDDVAVADVELRHASCEVVA